MKLWRIGELFTTESTYVYALLGKNFILRAIQFLPALLITFGIELGNSAVLSDNAKLLTDHLALMIFIPVMSAIAGNIGLQTSSSVVAYINIRRKEREPVSLSYIMRKYIAHNLINMLLLASLMAFIGAVWHRDIYPRGVVIFILQHVDCIGSWSTHICSIGSFHWSGTF